MCDLFLDNLHSIERNSMDIGHVELKLSNSYIGVRTVILIGGMKG